MWVGDIPSSPSLSGHCRLMQTSVVLRFCALSCRPADGIMARSHGGDTLVKLLSTHGSMGHGATSRLVRGACKWCNQYAPLPRVSVSGRTAEHPFGGCTEDLCGHRDAQSWSVIATRPSWIILILSEHDPSSFASAPEHRRLASLWISFA